jgi:hypothetical protein
MVKAQMTSTTPSVMIAAFFVAHCTNWGAIWSPARVAEGRRLAVTASMRMINKGTLNLPDAVNTAIAPRSHSAGPIQMPD